MALHSGSVSHFSSSAPRSPDPTERCPQLVGLDWGTCSCRAYLLDAGGQVLDHRCTGRGVLTITTGTAARRTAGRRGDAAGRRRRQLEPRRLGGRPAPEEPGSAPRPTGPGAASTTSPPRRRARGCLAIRHLLTRPAPGQKQTRRRTHEDHVDDDVHRAPALAFPQDRDR
ncbi:hypothetical protein BKD30_14195 [Tersicoccus phoenicis]|uniref:Uncharacterized protein n=1 Tax=Tersicoccus phoenicis TaxID=554083 RepID=A0A1R1L666_9MICC|nr:hypothetical protein BKD30_14195 [Tersicoccus phoenicis]